MLFIKGFFCHVIKFQHRRIASVILVGAILCVQNIQRRNVQSDVRMSIKLDIPPQYYAPVPQK